MGTFLKFADFSGVRSKLALLVVASVLPIMVVAGFLVYSHYDLERLQAREVSIERARAMVSALDREFALHESALLALSISPLLLSKDLSGFHAQAVSELKYIDADSILLLDTSGQMLLNTRRPYGQALPKLESTPLLKRIITTGRPGVSDMFKGPMGSFPIVTIAVPVKVDGVVAYSLNAAIEPQRFAMLLKEQKLPDNWLASVVDSRGTVVAQSHDVHDGVGAKMNAELLHSLESSREGSLETTRSDRSPEFIAYSRSELYDWTIVLHVPVADVTSQAYRTMYLLAITSFVALAIGFGLARFIGGRIASCIVSLVPPAKALGFGDTVQVPAMYFSEAEELGRALVGAASILQQAKFDSLHDGLTSLPNRTSFRFIIDQQLMLCQRNQMPLSILFIDLDGFKAVNDTHGHTIGDALLIAVSERIRTMIRDSDVAARLGGDEFAVALIHSDEINAVKLAEKLIAGLAFPYQLENIEAKISASIGVATYPESGLDGATLIKHADEAMYEAKELGKNKVCIYRDA